MRAIAVPSELSADKAAQATRTIGDAYIVAHQLDPQSGAALIAAGKVAFSQAHTQLLTAAGILIAVLSVIVFMTLKGHRGSVGGHH